ncbi:MAG: Lrp/AsnC family transcriptional regulator [Micrococcaceae bacterium]|nr:Lrp/AsnC family transcriptional regulator [Micrococcaceae bacterium]
MKNIELDGLDLQIINALQIEPRASWSSLAPVIGVDSLTLARRWERITAHGLAWPVAMLHDSRSASNAIVEVQCHPGQVLDTARHASRDPAISSIDLTSGTRDIIMTLGARNDDELADYILTRLGKLPGVRSLRTYILNSTLKLGSKWTLRALSPAQAGRVPRFRPPRAAAAKVVPGTLASRLVGLLEQNLRSTNTELGQALGIGSQRVADAIATLRTEGILDLRVHLSQNYSNWPVVTWYFLQVPSISLLATDHAWLSMPEIQFAGVTFGQYNLIVALTAHSRADTLRLEAELEGRIHGARVVDRSAVIRVHKHIGHILDASGCATGEIVSLLRP